MDWKQVSIIDKDLVQYLRKKFPSPKYDAKATNDELVRRLALQGGREEVIAAIDQVITMQKKGVSS